MRRGGQSKKIRKKGGCSIKECNKREWGRLQERPVRERIETEASRKHTMALTRIVLPGAFKLTTFVPLHFLVIVAAMRHDKREKHKQNRWTAPARGQRHDLIRQQTRQKHHPKRKRVCVGRTN